MSAGHLTLWQIELLPWYGFLMVWLVASFWVKAAKVTETLWSRLVHGLLLALGFYLLFARSVGLAPLEGRFVPVSFKVEAAGIALTWAGTALAIWARVILGRNWSARVTRKVDHELMRTGPYAFVRHPIYTGLFLAALGTALFLGRWRGLLAVVLVLAGESFKAKREERFMIAEFGEKYREYQQQTGFLIPGI